jgi:hypothetical protein
MVADDLVRDVSPTEPSRTLIAPHAMLASARGGTRTRKPFRAMDFESIAFAEFRHPGVLR